MFSNIFPTVDVLKFHGQRRERRALQVVNIYTYPYHEKYQYRDDSRTKIWQTCLLDILEESDPDVKKASSRILYPEQSLDLGGDHLHKYSYEGVRLNGKGGGLQIKMAFFIFTWIATADEKAVMTGSETKCKRNPK